MEQEIDGDTPVKRPKKRRRRSYMPLIFLVFLGMIAASLVVGFMVLNSNAQPDFEYTGAEVQDTSVPIEGYEIPEQPEVKFEFEDEIEAPE
ncbi:MAG: hypothetical protein AAFR27_00600 [Pseudomonadota bacterium]